MSEPALTLTDVVKHFAGAAHATLDGVCLTLAKAQTIAIVGASGCGKSTLLNVVAGLEPVDRGTVFVGKTHMTGQNGSIEDDTALVRQRDIGFIFQSFLLLPYLNAIDNAALPLQLNGVNKRSRQEQARSLLAALGLDQRRHAWPRELSGGELQRVAIARALIHNPILVLADEPTGNLDEDTSAQTLDVMFSAFERSNAACLLVTHSQRVAERAHQTVVLEHGRLRAIN